MEFEEGHKNKKPLTTRLKNFSRRIVGAKNTLILADCKPIQPHFRTCDRHGGLSLSCEQGLLVLVDAHHWNIIDFIF